MVGLQRGALLAPHARRLGLDLRLSSTTHFDSEPLGSLWAAFFYSLLRGGHPPALARCYGSGNHPAWERKMTRALFPVLNFVFAAAGIIVLVTDYSLAQSDPDAAQCQQIRQAVAQYGYEAARRHAEAHYGPEAVKMGDRCLTGADRRPAGESRIRPHQGGPYVISPGYPYRY